MSSDPLSDVLQLTEAKSVISGGFEAGGAWALRFPPSTEMMPDGSTAVTGSAPTGNLEAAHRASGAPFVTAASSMAPKTALARAAMTAVGALMSLRPLREAAKRRLARVDLPRPPIHPRSRGRTRGSSGPTAAPGRAGSARATA